MPDEDLTEALVKLADSLIRYEKLKFYENAVPKVCEATDGLKSYGFSQNDSDEVLMAIASLGKFKLNGHAIRFMLHFFFGNGEPLEFELADLLDEDSGVRQRVSSVISERLLSPLGAQHHSANGICSRLKPRPEFFPEEGKPKYKSPDEFPIRQKPLDYKNEDWHDATGSLPVEWEAISLTDIPKGSVGPMCVQKLGHEWIDSGTMARVRTPLKQPLIRTSNTTLPKYALVWAIKIWKWHNTDADKSQKRITDCIHKAGYRLNESGAAKNYWVYGKPCIVEVKTGKPIKFG